ncbi:MAG: DHH family phosphoesterase [Phycisphaerales bacterium]|nr:DHH family phosphoesterase [Phycisphaerales bacterium]
MSSRNHRSDRLLRVLAEYERIVVTTHDTPDPDAIAAGWGLYTLCRERLKKPVRLIGGGAIVRAENVHMVRLLKPPIELVDAFTPDAATATVLVDCAPSQANHLLGNGHAPPVAVIDHHAVTGKPVRVKFRDVRPRMAASATMVAGYLRAQVLTPSRELATALMYAVRTEVIGTSTRFTRAERGVLGWLTEFVDHQLLQEIENAPLARSYYEDLILAIVNTFLYEDVAVSFLPRSASAEIVGEVADLLVRYAEAQRVFCATVIENNLLVSARTTADGGDAVALLGRTLKGVGHWGGHRNRAGGKVIGRDQSGKLTQALLDDLKLKWLRACGVEDVRGTRLVARKDILSLL